jgi:hypothetical protein
MLDSVVEEDQFEFLAGFDPVVVVVLLDCDVPSFPELVHLGDPLVLPRPILDNDSILVPDIKPHKIKEIYIFPLDLRFHISLTREPSAGYIHDVIDDLLLVFVVDQFVDEDSLAFVLPEGD